MSRRKHPLKKFSTAFIFLLPGLLLFITFIILPMLYSFRISFYDWKIVNPDQSEWIGVDNYVRALSDPIFRRAALNTAIYSLVTVPGQMILGLILAVLLNQDIRGRSFFRFMYYLPVITSWVILSLLFEYMFSGQAGLINYLLRDLLHITSENILWLADPILTFVPIHLLGIWKGIGWTAVIFLAGLQAIPRHLYEAAEVDGADAFSSFYAITVPLLRPTTMYLLVVLTIGSLNAYISNLLITNGGNPMDLTHFILTLMYEATFTKLDFGYGSAISYLLTMCVFVISVVQIRMMTKKVEA
ncbi:MAG: sugar ABC transporter permease [Anaerolineaceae bacterium]|nr:sugar ABC transporter permease [Anaerolineaceae bacterium]